MKGRYSIRVSNSRVRYEFEIRRNISILQGNSATGKTTLVEMVDEYFNNGPDSGIDLTCEKECRVLGGRNWAVILETIKDSIVFIDEGNDFVASKEFAKRTRSSDNYYVIVTREGLPNLPYSIEEIYGIRESSKYASLKQVYNEWYPIYGSFKNIRRLQIKDLICEDTNAGYDFFKSVASDCGINAIASGGKSNIYSLAKLHSEEGLMVIADGAAFGAEMNRLSKLLEQHENIVLCLPESFEWILLKSGLVDGNRVEQILETPADYIDSKDFFSWERFFTRLLIDETKDTYLKYSKTRLNPVYLQNREKYQIRSALRNILGFDPFDSESIGQ